MRVLMVCSQYPPVYGGAGAQASLLSRMLSERGAAIEIVTLDQYGVGSSAGSGYRVTRVLRGVAARSLLTRVLTTVSLALVAGLRVMVVRPSVVHIHGAFWWSIFPALVGRIVGSIVVVKVTRDGQDDPTTVSAKRLGPLPLGRIYSLSFRLAHRIIVLNKEALDSAYAAGWGRKATIARNGVDVAALERTPQRRFDARRATGLEPRDRVALFVGFLAEHKGVVDLLEAWTRMGDRAAQLWLVGPIEGFYRELGDRVVDELAKAQAQGFDVRALGHIPQDELSELYWAADVFVLPSYKEGMPNSLMEAVVAGCQIVSTSIPGVVDIVTSQQAHLVPPGDITSLAEALGAALSGPPLDTSAAARAMSIDAVADFYLDLYREGAVP